MFQVDTCVGVGRDEGKRKLGERLWAEVVIWSQEIDVWNQGNGKVRRQKQDKGEKEEEKDQDG